MIISMDGIDQILINILFGPCPMAGGSAPIFDYLLQVFLYLLIMYFHYFWITNFFDEVTFKKLSTNIVEIPHPGGADNSHYPS